MSTQPSNLEVETSADRAPAPRYKLTPYSLPWLILAPLLIAYEIVMVIQGHEGGPLTHVVKWAYGEPLSARWWLLGWANTGFLVWLPPHFLFEGWGLRSLLTLVGIGLAIGLAGIFVTR